MKKQLLWTINIIFLLFCFISNCYAEDTYNLNVPFSKSKNIKNWTSSYWKTSGENFVRLASKDENNINSSIHIDIYRSDLIFVKLFKVGDKSEVNKFFGYLGDKEVTEGLTVRIDKRPIIKVQGIMTYFNINPYMLEGDLYLKNIPSRFFSECSEGNVLRIEFQQSNGIRRYFKFSLSGFNASLLRSISLLKNTQNDEDFFK